MRVDSRCWLSGPQFSPPKLAKRLGIVFYLSNEPGEVVKGTTRQYGEGNANLSFSLYEKEGDPFQSESKLLRFLEDNMDAIKEEGVTEMEWKYTVAYSEQCNFTIEAAVLERLGRLGIPMSITCYKDSKRNIKSYHLNAKPERKQQGEE